MTFIYKDWHEMLPFALQEYCTSSAHFNRGNPPTIPQYTTQRKCLTWRSKSHR